MGHRVVNILNKNGDSMASIGNNVPDKKLGGAFPVFQCLYPELRYVDTTQEPKLKYGCSHLNIWSWYKYKGNDTPNDADPSTLERKGNMHTCNPTQFTPQHLNKTYEQESRGTILMHVLQPIIRHLAEVMKKQFPKENGELEAFVTKLQYNGVSEAHPFAGVVVNVNVATITHLDPMDLYLCLVLALHACTGGELVLEELGIIINFKLGDFVIFPSTIIMHYDLHFKGLRASFAFSTDKHGKAWVRNNNSWDTNDYMKASTSNTTT
ncbi:hypothetical protein PM082_024855 [Marasmius tenuissimus]|nr:hypothetical protein PM082_024855 [Marasmius tenuissimus]